MSPLAYGRWGGVAVVARPDVAVRGAPAAAQGGGGFQPAALLGGPLRAPGAQGSKDRRRHRARKTARWKLGETLENLSAARMRTSFQNLLCTD